MSGHFIKLDQGLRMAANVSMYNYILELKSSFSHLDVHSGGVS